MSFIFPADPEFLTKVCAAQFVIQYFHGVLNLKSTLGGDFSKFDLTSAGQFELKNILRGLRPRVLIIYTPDDSLCRPSWQSVSFNLMLSSLAVRFDFFPTWRAK